MESFALAATHAGAITHNHNIALSPHAVDAFRELRYAVSIIVGGWVAVEALKLLRSKR